MTSNGNNNELTALFHLICGLSNESQSEQSNLTVLAGQTIRLMQVSLKSQLDQGQVGKPFSIPYKDLTDLVFRYPGDLPPSEMLANFRDLIMNNYCMMVATENEKQEKTNHFMFCYDKVINHLQLAQIQRDYIQEVIKRAEQIAETAKETADTAKETADTAKETADTAKKSAKKANKIYDTMFANYVTILGIFTAIIVTIFGGLNVVDTIISYGDTHFSTIVFLAALVLMCVVCLLYFLAKIILKLNGKDDDNQRFTLECLFGVVFGICLILILIAWCVSPTKITPEIGKKASQGKTEQKAN